MPSISSIRPIGHQVATKLRKSKVRTTESLLEQASTRAGRAQVSERTGIPTADLLLWAHQADMMRLMGVGSEYAELLVAAGVDTMKILRRRNDENLMEAMTHVNTRRRLVQRLPTVEMLQSWIDEAENIDVIVKS